MAVRPELLKKQDYFLSQEVAVLVCCNKTKHERPMATEATVCASEEVGQDPQKLMLNKTCYSKRCNRSCKFSSLK